MVGDSDECISAGQFAHKLVASTATATQHNLLLNPSNCSQTRATPRLQASSWKQVLNNLRLVIQPSVILNLLQPWLNPNSATISRVRVLLMNRFPSSLPCHEPYPDFYFSSA